MHGISTISIILIESQSLFKEGLKKILDTESVCRLLATGQTEQDAIQLIQKHKPNIALLDKNVFAMDNLHRIEEILYSSPETNIVILSDQTNDKNYVIHALKRGIRGYLLKEMSPHHFIQAIKTVYCDKFWLPPETSHYVVKEYQQTLKLVDEQLAIQEKTFQKPFHLFTTRECDVLELLVMGKNNKEIAKLLSLSVPTIKNYVSNILNKMNVEDRTMAVLLALKYGWFQLNVKRPTSEIKIR